MGFVYNQRNFVVFNELSLYSHFSALYSETRFTFDLKKTRNFKVFLGKDGKFNEELQVGHSIPRLPHLANSSFLIIHSSPRLQV